MSLQKCYIKKSKSEILNRQVKSNQDKESYKELNTKVIQTLLKFNLDITKVIKTFNKTNKKWSPYVTNITERNTE